MRHLELERPVCGLNVIDGIGENERSDADAADAAVVAADERPRLNNLSQDLSHYYSY